MNKSILVNDMFNICDLFAKIEPDSFDTNWGEECSNGIHFFFEKELAEKWNA